MSTTKGSILVTGANGGLGSAFVANLLKSVYAGQYRGIYAVRNPTTAHDLQNVLENGTKAHTSEVKALDLGSLESVRELAADINARVANGTLEPIRALVLNAAMQEANEKTLTPQSFTKDGFESNFGVNFLANLLFILLLLQSMDKKHGRIVIVSSWTHDTADSRNDSSGMYNGEEYKTMFTDTESLSKGIDYQDDGYKSGMRRYGTSKLLMIMLMFELQRRLNLDPELSNISVLSMDPGAMGGTGITRASPPLIRFVTGWIIVFLQDIMVWFSPNGMLRPARKSGADLLLASFDEKYLGEYPKAVYLDGSARAKCSAEALDTTKQRQLWADSVKLARVKSGETVLKGWNEPLA